jgi:hypothetical protein
MFVQLLILGEMGVSKEKAFPIHSGQMAVSLLQEYRITHVAKELGLNTRHLRKKQFAFKEKEQPENETQEKSCFIELNQLLPSVSPSFDVDSSIVELKIERRDGTRLTLSLNSSQTDMIQNLVTAFIRS